MKTAMQELIEYIELNIDDNDFIKHEVLEQADKLIEKEKEQIKDAHCWGWSDAYDNLQYNKSRLCEEYYNQTYNQNK